MGDPEGGAQKIGRFRHVFFEDFGQIHDHLPKPSLVEETRLLHFCTIFCEVYQIALLGVGFKKCSPILDPFFSFENIGKIENSIDTQTNNVKNT